MTCMVTVAFVELADYPACAAIDASFRAAGVADEDLLAEPRFREKMAHREVLVARVGGRIVGYLSFTYIWADAWIEYIRVLEEHRRQGVGRALLVQLEVMLRARGGKHLYSSSSADESPPQAWHRRMGFRDAGRLACRPDDAGGEVLFCKTFG